MSKLRIKIFPFFVEATGDGWIVRISSRAVEVNINGKTVLNVWDDAPDYWRKHHQVLP
jgi:hypothetical protein